MKASLCFTGRTDMKIYILDASRFTSKSAAHEHIKEVLSFPDYYGKNLDALDDCLSEMPPDVGVIMQFALNTQEDLEDVLGVKGRFMKV